MANGEYGDIGLRVRQRREELGLTREKMAERAGLSVQFMASVELGKQSMTTDSLKKVCRELCVSADYIVFGTRPGYSEHDLNAAVEPLSAEQRAYAEQMLRTFVQAIQSQR